MLKKTLSVLGLVYGGLAVAGTMGPVCAPGNVIVPCEANQWEFGVQALYLEPSHAHHLGVPVNTDANLLNSTFNTNWDWGYRLNGAFHFGTGSDFSLDWTHYTNDNNLGPYIGQYLQIVSPTAAIQNPAVYGLALEHRYDQVNLTMGQHVDMSARKHVRFYGGAQYAEMRIDGTSTYVVTNAQFLPSIGGGVRTFVNTDFSGAGPVMGIDYAYDLTPEFSVTANTSGSILYGNSRYNSATVYTNGLVVQSAYGNRRTIVPGFEAKLGANYACNMAYGQLNLVGGYQVTNYFDVLQAVSSPVTNEIYSSNYALHGPYFGVKWLGNA